jgi:isocitrate/isopropylmalate dehydrogenase
MAEAPHGTAPRLEGKNVANPLAIATVGNGVATADLGGHATTTEFTDAVIYLLTAKP